MEDTHPNPNRLAEILLGTDRLQITWFIQNTKNRHLIMLTIVHYRQIFAFAIQWTLTGGHTSRAWTDGCAATGHIILVLMLSYCRPARSVPLQFSALHHVLSCTYCLVILEHLLPLAARPASDREPGYLQHPSQKNPSPGNTATYHAQGPTVTWSTSRMPVPPSTHKLPSK